MDVFLCDFLLSAIARIKRLLIAYLASAREYIGGFMSNASCRMFSFRYSISTVLYNLENQLR